MGFFGQLLAFLKITNPATHAQIAPVFASFIVTLSTTSEMLPLKTSAFVPCRDNQHYSK